MNVINFLQKQPDWSSTAVVIAYDDSDGWYDHQIGADREPVDHRRAMRSPAPARAATATDALPGVNRRRCTRKAAAATGRACRAGDLALAKHNLSITR